MSLDTYQSIEGYDIPPVSDTDPDNIHLSLHSSNDSLHEEMENNYLPGTAQNHSSEEHLDIDSERLHDENCQEQQQHVEQIKDVHRNQLHLLKKLLVFEGSSRAVKLTFKKGVIVLEGRKGDVVKKKKEILEMMDSFVNETFEMPEGVTKMLRMKEFCHYIEKILMFLTIVWAADWNSITIYGRTRDSLHRGYRVIMDELVCCKIELNEENLENLKRPPWLEVVNKLSHPLLMLEQTGTMLEIYGTCEKAQRFKAEIGKLLCHYKVHVANYRVPLAAFSFFVSCYISKECQDIVKSFQSVGIDFDYVSCSCIISGPSRLIPKIERLIACLAEKIKKYELDLKRRGMSNHFLSPTGMMVLENMQYKYGVFIQNITEGYQEVIQGNGCVNIHSLANDIGNGKRLRNGVIVRLKVGQILESSADARVNVISKELKRYEGMCENRGARIIQLECDENILVSDSGSVPCQKVFHVVSPDVKNGDCLANIRRTVTSILNKAVELRCTSLAIPLIGALFSVLTPDKLYKTIQEAVTEWAKVNSDCVLREVWFVGESYQVNHFLSLMNLNDEFRDSMAIPMDPAHQSHATNQSCLSYETLVKLRLFTRDVSVVSKVLKELEQYSSQVIKSCVIEDEISATIFKKLTVEQVGQIQALEKKFCVRIEVNKIQCRIHIEGEQQYIAEVKYRILELLKLL